jgi:hypothetical protein
MFSIFRGAVLVPSSEFIFNLYCTIRKRYSASDGWDIREQETLLDGSKVDFYVVQRNKSWSILYAVVIDAKDEQSITMQDIDRLFHCSSVCRANEQIIYIAKDTHVPSSVQKYADDMQVKIIRSDRQYS